MTPLEDYPTIPGPDDQISGQHFQLLYEPGEPKDPNATTEVASGLRRYIYRRGKAIVFSSRFRHSTEPWVEPGSNSTCLNRTTQPSRILLSTSCTSTVQRLRGTGAATGVSLLRLRDGPAIPLAGHSAGT